MWTKIPETTEKEIVKKEVFSKKRVSSYKWKGWSWSEVLGLFAEKDFRVEPSDHVIVNAYDYDKHQFKIIVTRDVLETDAEAAKRVRHAKRMNKATLRSRQDTYKKLQKEFG